jgi:hypothetical protein
MKISWYQTNFCMRILSKKETVNLRSDRRKIILACAADRADPVGGKILECCSRSDSTFDIAFRRIIHIAAEIAFVLFHGDTLPGE